MSIVNDLKNHFKFHLAETKFENLFQFYTIAMCLTLLMHLGMGVISGPNLQVRRLNNAADWILVSIIMLSILTWKMSARIPEIRKLVNIGYFLGFLIASITTATTYISLILSPSLTDLLVKLIPVILAISAVLALYKYGDKVSHNINSGIPIVVFLTIIVGYSKDLGLYLAAYFALPFALMWNMYFSATLIFLELKNQNKTGN